jgi:exopolysaccharide biosynthesis polyprenyl glycosylphosphotransferase
VLPQFLLTAFGVWLVILAERMLLDRIRAVLVAGQGGAARLVVVGSSDAAEGLALRYGVAETGDLLFVGNIDPEILGAVDGHVEVGGLVAAIRRLRAASILISPEVTGEKLRAIIDTASAAGCQVLVVPEFFESTGIQPTVAWRNRTPVIELVTPVLVAPQLFAKRVLDLVVGSIVLLLSSPLLLLVALAVRLDSLGPALYGHPRLGRNGRVFRCMKFRSMRLGADDELRGDPALYAEYVANGYKLQPSRDPRVSRVGRLLRRWSIDELPQLLNVLQGSMSLVGPRPIVPEEIVHYSRHTALFLSLKPGMTGAWAVSGRSDVAYPDRVDLELEYIRTWGLTSDLGILCRTVPAVLARKGAH